MEIGALLEAGRYREAFEMLMGQYQDKVLRLAWSMLGDRALAEETAQDIFLRIWKALPRFRRESSLSTWIYRIARNTCLTSLQAKPRTLPLGNFAARAGPPPLPPERRTPDVVALVARLPEPYRRVITLFYMEEKSYEEVARQLDLPLGTVKTYLHRARRALGAKMTGGGA